MGELGVLAGQRGEMSAAIGDHDAIADGFRAEPMLVAGFDPEDIACQMEGVDLAASVAHELGGAHYAGENLIDESSPVALGEDLLILGEGPDGADGRGRDIGKLRERADIQVQRKQGRRSGLGEERSLHRTLVNLWY